jgi:hypothetical protein
MKKNMGSIDRLIRGIIAVTLIALYSMGVLTGMPGIILIGLSVIFALTSLFSFCPLYLPFGLSTQRRKLNNKN